MTSEEREIRYQTFLALRDALGSEIIRREFEFHFHDGEKRQIVAKIWKPVQEKPGDPYTWICLKQIEGLQGDRLRGIFGVDGWQALTCALDIAKVEIDLVSKSSEGTLYAFGQPYDPTLKT